MGTYPSLCKMFLLKCFALILPLVSAKNLTQHVEHICIETGTMSHADTDDMVTGTLHGSLGTCETMELGYSHYNDWEKGAYDCYGRSEGLGNCQAQRQSMLQLESDLVSKPLQSPYPPNRLPIHF